MHVQAVTHAAEALPRIRAIRWTPVLTSNRSFGEWGDVFGDSVVAAALLDRLLHHAIVVQIEGTSYRLREHADLLPDHLRNRPSSLNPVPAEPARRRPGRPRRNPFDHVAG